MTQLPYTVQSSWADEWEPTPWRCLQETVSIITYNFTKIHLILVPSLSQQWTHTVETLSPGRIHTRVTIKCLEYVLDHGDICYPCPQGAYSVDEETIREYSYVQSKVQCGKCRRECIQSVQMTDLPVAKAWVFIKTEMWFLWEGRNNHDFVTGTLFIPPPTPRKKRKKEEEEGLYVIGYGPCL